ncbi:MAG: preprotein translocase subunit SecY [Candidatus Eisenbacteria bacterium]|uniref:Protein translocase subunit SecY n=1 Tax=Eiseniibacteriota bacterium TaxID=2212470 RepID=A0A948RWY1_UNCEI|nr:preprotein translocase subunit SecY [Candidatus Eisenbacteria bacterium]MBU1950606.1 preprotein translocase subunit SecY [Candidatus Eisenbacteria bacterium]MBU2691139.1 preprotein translocase subunit SecY [Candidatus Eisenbacteria bacterium]
MLQSFQSMFKIPELKRRLLMTALLLVIYRLGGHIPTPIVDGGALAAYFKSQAQGTLLGLYDLFVGGNFSKATIFALGIMPYISASIILQLFGAVIPYFERLQKEGEEGRKKITQYTRYGTVLLSLVQSFGISIFLESLNSRSDIPIVTHPGFAFRLLTMLTMTTGTVFVMWLGEQITEKGIGNGISLIIFIGIVARSPNDIINTTRLVISGGLSIFTLIFVVIFMIASTGFVVWMTKAQRKIPVQYAKRIVGRRMYGGQSTHIPLRVNTAGVIPIIFAQSIVVFPGTLASFFPSSEGMQSLVQIFRPGDFVYSFMYGLLIIFFSYFYTAIVLNPQDLADNMKKYGGFIPGVRPGQTTARYIDRIMTRITLPGSLYLALIAILPDMLIQRLGVPFYFGGTSLLIIVGVALDTLQQIESHLLIRHYDGFLKKGKLRARR